MRQYPENKYSHTHKTSTAAKRMIRAQAEQIRETPAEYVARKCKENERRKGESNDREIF